jgi:alpha-galactosidase
VAQYVDPLRQRMDFLNNARNVELYAGDPLAPACYRGDYLFASVMFASPLAWFEVCGLGDDFVREVAPLVRTWKAHRREIVASTIIPIGDTPDGTSWTGFAAVADEGSSGHVLIFRELNDRAVCEFDLPMLPRQRYAVTPLAGDGEVALSRGRGRIGIATPLQFVFARVVAD